MVRDIAIEVLGNSRETRNGVPKSERQPIYVRCVREGRMGRHGVHADELDGQALGWRDSEWKNGRMPLKFRSQLLLR